MTKVGVVPLEDTRPQLKISHPGKGVYNFQKNEVKNVLVKIVVSP